MRRILFDDGPLAGTHIDFTDYEWPPPAEMGAGAANSAGDEAIFLYRRGLVDPVDPRIGDHPAICLTAHYEYVTEISPARWSEQRNAAGSN